MTKLDHALALAAAGFHVFPLQPNGKKPPKDMHFKEAATRDPDTIRQWFAADDANIGIFTGRFGDAGALLVIDVDDKGGRRGRESLLALELDGDLPRTREHVSASGGRHIFYRVAEPVRQSVDLLGSGLDVRSRGGYVVGPGSSVGGKEYVGSNAGVVDAPAWLIERCGRGREREENQPAPVGIDSDRAQHRAVHFLVNEARVAVEGDAGDVTTFKVAARLKDIGCSEGEAYALLLEHWNERCSPPWNLDDLRTKVRNAYAYGFETPGAAAPEADFQPIVTDAIKADGKHPLTQLNQQFAFVLAGGGSHVLWETTDKDGRWNLQHLNMSAFHQKHAALKLTYGNKSSPLTEEWMEWSGRRSYDGLVFMPQQQAPARFYNLWKGFAVEPWPADKPVTRDAQAALDAFLEHAHRNVCRANDENFRWLLGWFAHLVQRPAEKPLVATVFRGGKGVGKNACVETVGNLLGGHFLLTSNRRYLIGNFNGHLENCLLFALDEAFWSGDKQAEGTIKDLITGKSHVIEHKGKEPYTVDNRTRVAIIGNEDWLVPATHDERRFSVFDVGDGRKQDRAFFQTMRERMESGGYALLLRHLLGVSLDGLDLNAAPATGALLDQKHATLEPVQAWWLTCLTEGRVVGADFGGAWPVDAISTDRFRQAFTRYSKERNIRGRLPDEREMGRHLKKCIPLKAKGRARIEGALEYVYRLGTLADCRAAWDAYIGHAVEWGE